MISYNNGHKQHRSGGGGTPKPQFGPTANIIKTLAPQLTDALKTQLIAGPKQAESLANREIQQATQAVRGGYAARGLAGGGIAQAGETQAASDIAMQVGQQYANQLIGVGQLGTGSPSYAPQQQPRGFLGMK